MQFRSGQSVPITVAPTGQTDRRWPRGQCPRRRTSRCTLPRRQLTISDFRLPVPPPRAHFPSPSVAGYGRLPWPQICGNGKTRRISMRLSPRGTTLGGPLRSARVPSEPSGSLCRRPKRRGQSASAIYFFNRRHGTDASGSVAITSEQLLSCMRRYGDAQQCATALCQFALDTGSRGSDVSCMVIDIAEKNSLT
jgi:hypothetical protein